LLRRRTVLTYYLFHFFCWKNNRTAGADEAKINRENGKHNNIKEE
jgi:hypothetical protein